MQNMTRTGFLKQILLIELTGFVFVLLLLWMDEIVDLPHMLFGAPSTPINVAECITETVVVSLLGIIVLLTTFHLLRQIKVLEGILPVCSFCKKIRSQDSWIAIDDYVRDHSEAQFSHSVCPQCAKAHYGNL
jgi:hypothetical protein